MVEVEPRVGASLNRSSAGAMLWWARLRPVAIVLFLLGAGAALNALLFSVHHFLDAWVYFGGSGHLLHGQDLYDPAGIALPVKPSPLPFTYPPFAAMAFVALFGGSFVHGILLLSVLGLAALFLSCLLAARGLIEQPQPALVLAVAACGVGMALEPIRETLSYGQINLVLLGLVAADCLTKRPKWPRGVLIGIAAAIKLTPAAFVLYFLARREWKQAATVGLSFAVCSGLGWLLAPASSAKYWFQDVLDPTRVGPVGFVTNESLRGTIERTIGHGPVATMLWIVACLAAVAAALVSSARLRAVGEDVIAWVTVAVTVTLISPVSWSHHWVWVAAGLAAVGYRAAQRRSWLGLLLTGVAVWIFWMGAHWQLFDVPPQTWSGWQHVKEEGYVLTGIVFLAAVTAAPRWFVAPEVVGDVPFAFRGKGTRRRRGSLQE